MNKNKSILILIFILGALFSLSGCKIKEKEDREFDEQTRYLLKLIEEYSYYFEDEALLKEGALRGIVAALEDPYSVYFDEDEFSSFMGQVSGNFAGVGISIVNTGDYTVISNVIEGSPAQSAGLVRGDIIMKIDGQDTLGKTPTEIATMIRGEIDTNRTITVSRGSLVDFVEVDVIIQSVTSQTVDFQVFNENEQVIGYLKISSFSGETFGQFKAAVDALDKLNITDLIIDVRNNPGGSLTTVLDMLDYLLDTKQPLMYSRDKNGKLDEYVQDNYNTTVDYEVMVLINENSASASEIFAATLNELANYELIGKTTFGKGTMQLTFPLNVDQTIAVKLTIENWLTPFKESIQGVGVSPTTEVDWESIYTLSFLDYAMKVEVDTVNLQAIFLQTFLQKLGNDIRNDGYIDQSTIDALSDYQTSLQIEHSVTFAQLGSLDFMTVYYINQDVIDIVEDLSIDEQFQAAYLMALTN